jgi:hypothetical protein
MAFMVRRARLRWITMIKGGEDWEKVKKEKEDVDVRGAKG